MPHTYDLDAYRKHAEAFGPECVIETAAHDLTDADLGELVAFIDSKQRAFRWKGDRWQERRQPVRTCEFCHRELPPTASPRVRYHRYCRSTAKKRRQRAASGSRVAVATGSGGLGAALRPDVPPFAADPDPTPSRARLGGDNGSQNGSGGFGEATSA